MAYTQVLPTAPSMAGATVTYSAVPAGGLAVLPGSFVLIKNGGGSSITVTIRAQKTYRGYTLTNPTVTVGAGVEIALGPLPADVHQVTLPSDSNFGYILLDFSGVTTVTAAVLNVPQ